jgi:peptidoglycan DL-endopeptidase CwlO
VLSRATALLDSRRVEVDGQGWRSDCSGLVTCCYAAVDAELTDARFGHPSITTVIWRTMDDRGLLRDEPLRGDLVFFDDTHDRNSNGQRDDPLTHIGIVEEVAEDGTVTFVHHASGRVKRSVLNLERPGQHTDPATGEEWNSWLRRGDGGQRLAGQLLRGFARPLAEPSTVRAQPQ